MRMANLDGRLVVITGSEGAELAHDVGKISSGRFGADPQSVYDDWAEFVAWARGVEWEGGTTVSAKHLGSPAPSPRQVFAIGLNYRDHAAESRFAAPESEPPVFTKFQSCITGPVADVLVPGDAHVDWEVELVAVIGRRSYQLPADQALDAVAGFAVGQDISDRILQFAAQPPQFSLGKSRPGFGPIGPWLVTLDEFDDPDDLELGCALNGQTVQNARTSQMIFTVAELVAKLSARAPLLPGDVIFTGTPSGIGAARTPPRWLTEGDVLTSYIAGIGRLEQRFIGEASTSL